MQIETSTNITPYGKIYRLTNKINGKMYHGQTIDDVNIRWDKYKRLDCKRQPKLYPALKKYGPENFLFEVVDESPQDQIQLDNKEMFYIAKFDSFHNGYNCNEGGRGCGKMSEETKLKISKANKGNYHSDETKKKISEANSGNKNGMFGQHHSIETKQKISKALSGRILSAETKKKLSEGKMGNKHPMFGVYGDKAPMWGKHHSKESKRKMSESRKGINNHNFGKQFSDETKRKIGQASKGRCKGRKRHYLADGSYRLI